MQVARDSPQPSLTDMAAGGLSAEHAMSKQLPAPKTFAPSREDVLSNLAFFFGDPVRVGGLTSVFAFGSWMMRLPCVHAHPLCGAQAVPEKLRDYSEHHAMT